MAAPVHVPRVNNNDDQVKLVSLSVGVGQKVEVGELLAQVETDKAVVDVEAAQGGYVLACQGVVDEMIEVGSVLLWIGSTADETVPQMASAAPRDEAAPSRQPTAKALALLRAHGLSAEDVRASGARLSVADVEQFVARGGSPAPRAATPAAAVPPDRKPEIDGRLCDLSPTERGMLGTVLWHRDQAASGYIELEFDPAPWDAYAKQFSATHRLLFSPLLALMTYRLVELARETPSLNATIVGNQRLEYASVNAGFTVQAGETLYLTVVRDAQSMTDLQFVNALVELQKSASLHKLGAAETSGATIGFSSMARWKVSRHIPLLAPNTALMLAHAQPAIDRAVLGASYDHRVLNGYHVASTLRRLSTPPSDAQ